MTEAVSLHMQANEKIKRKLSNLKDVMLLEAK